MNIYRLKGKIVEKGYSVERFADAVGIKRSSFYRKLSNFEKITIGEAKRMAAVLGLTGEEATDIFLS